MPSRIDHPPTPPSAPAFHVTNTAAAGSAVSNVRSIAVVAMGFVSVLLVGLLVGLVAYEPNTPWWALPVGLFVLWKMDVFVWLPDLRTGWALRRAQVDREVEARSLPALRRFVLSDVFARTVSAFEAQTLDIRMVWRWGKAGLEAYALVATAGPGKTLALKLEQDWKPETISWSHPSLAPLAGRRQRIVDGRWETEIGCIALDVPVGSAHARMALFAWATQNNDCSQATT